MHLVVRRRAEAPRVSTVEVALAVLVVDVAGTLGRIQAQHRAILPRGHLEINLEGSLAVDPDHVSEAHEAVRARALRVGWDERPGSLATRPNIHATLSTLDKVL